MTLRYRKKVKILSAKNTKWTFTTLVENRKKLQNLFLSMFIYYFFIWVTAGYTTTCFSGWSDAQHKQQRTVKNRQGKHLNYEEFNHFVWFRFYSSSKWNIKTQSSFSFFFLHASQRETKMVFIAKATVIYWNFRRKIVDWCQWGIDKLCARRMSNWKHFCMHNPITNLFYGQKMIFHSLMTFFNFWNCSNFTDITKCFHTKLM